MLEIVLLSQLYHSHVAGRMSSHFRTYEIHDMTRPLEYNTGVYTSILRAKHN